MENKELQLPARNPAGINGTMRVDHVALRTIDLAGTVGWYTEKLGFRVIKRFAVRDLQFAFLAPANDDRVWLEVISGGATGAPQDTSLPVAAGFQHLCLAVDNVDETLAALRERGVTISREPFDVPLIGVRCGFASDLYGNTLEFIQNLN